MNPERKNKGQKEYTRKEFLSLAGKNVLLLMALNTLSEQTSHAGEEKPIKNKEVKKMARLAYNDKKEPYELKDAKAPLWVCGCGLSKNKPFCDGSHKRCQDEEHNALYLYDDKSRVKITGD